MREIKFRVWDERKELIFDTPILHFTLCNEYHGTYGIGNLFTHEHTVLMQYTGLKDKNGKEIYEGDILRVWNDDDVSYDDNENETVHNAIVTTVSDFNVIEVYGCEFDTWTLPWAFENGFNGDVIGNIHENPELLADQLKA